MARQFRIQTTDLYLKLGIKKANTQRASSNRHQKVRSPVDISKQLPRPDICRYCQDVNPNRFISFNSSPQALSNTKRVPSPNFRLYQGRRNSLMYTSLKNQPQYDPNYSSVWKNSEKGLIAFDKLQGRKDSRPQTNDIVNNIKYTLVDKKIAGPLIAKSRPKPSDPILPAFMLENFTRSRVITQKTLEMNNYPNGQYLPLDSSFGQGWKQSESFHARPIRGRRPRVLKLLSNGISILN